MDLIIAEKPSVGKSIAVVVGAGNKHDGYTEGNGYIVSWCLGHLVELADADAYDEKYKKWNRADLPIIPETYKWFVSEDKKKQFNILRSLMQRVDVNSIICATDAGREGELIFRLVYNIAGCRKPFKRLWISSMEASAIKNGLNDIKDGHAYDDLYRAALSRSKADWLVGINATRLFSTLYNKRLVVGRVQTPTLAMIVQRDQSIGAFVKQKYFNVNLDCGDFTFTKEKIFEHDVAEEIRNKCVGEELNITNVTKEIKNVNPPKLYDLTTLQREANRYFGYTAEQTHNAAQALYEAGFISYPRTDSHYLTEDMGDYTSSVIEEVCSKFDWNKYICDGINIERCMDDTKVTDHHALIPTKQIGEIELQDLPLEEKDILFLISARLLCATGQKHQYQKTSVKACCAGEEFVAKGNHVISDGWKAIENSLIKKSQDENDEKLIQSLQEGQAYIVNEAFITEHYTSPPDEYTEDTLLSAMERAGNEDFDDDTEKKGLGTPATRAAIIEKLIKGHYVIRNGKQLLPTVDGYNLIEIVPDELKSPKLTAEWENTLMQIEKGNVDATSFMEGITSSIKQIVDEHKEITEDEKVRFADKSSEKEILGTCPRCGMAVYEGSKNYYCCNKECNFVIWKESKWLAGMKKKITPGMAKSLLKNGRVHVKGLYSAKKGTKFDADLVLDDTGKYINFHLEFSDKRNAS